MRNNYWHQEIHSKQFYFLNVTFPTRQAALHSLKVRILYKILSRFKRKMVKMQYTSVKQMGQMNIFKEKEEFNTYTFVSFDSH